MNRQPIFNRFFSTLIIYWFITGISHGQGIDIGNTRSEGKAYLGFYIAPAQTSINNTIPMDIGKPQEVKKISFFGTLEAGYYFSSHIGISSGIGYGSYISELTLNSYSAVINTTDGDNDNYQRHIQGTDLSENQKIGFIHVPLLINLQWLIGQRSGLEIQSGVNFNIPISKKYSSQGIFSYTGFYPEYNITFANIPYENFSNDVKNEASDNLLIKSFSPELAIAGNFFMMLQDNIRLSAGLIYNNIISNISGYQAAEDFVLSSKPSEMNSFMESSSNVTDSALGFRIGIRYYMK